jgi:hypothetical protein
MEEIRTEDWTCKVCKASEDKALHFFGGPDICDPCYFQKSQVLEEQLKNKSHTCMRELLFGVYMKVQWCGEEKCRSRDEKNQENQTCEKPDQLQVWHDTTDETKWHRIVSLTRMNYSTWLQVDRMQRFSTFKQAVEGYICKKCHSQTTEKNPIYARSSYAFFFCLHCVQNIRATVVPQTSGSYSLCSILALQN